MNERTLIVELPQTLFDQLQERAARTNRTVEDEAVLALAATVSEANALPSDLATTLASFSVFEDETLWQLARARVSDNDADRLEELSDKRQRTGLTNEAMREVEELIAHRDRARRQGRVCGASEAAGS